MSEPHDLLLAAAASASTPAALSTAAASLSAAPSCLHSRALFARSALRALAHAAQGALEALAVTLGLKEPFPSNSEICAVALDRIMMAGLQADLDPLDTEHRIWMCDGKTTIEFSAPAAAGVIDMLRANDEILAAGRNKTYSALVFGWPLEDAWEIEAPLLRQGLHHPSRIWLKQCIHPEGSSARTSFCTLGRFTATNAATTRFSRPAWAYIQR